MGPELKTFLQMEVGEQVDFLQMVESDDDRANQMFKHVVCQGLDEATPLSGFPEMTMDAIIKGLSAVWSEVRPRYLKLFGFVVHARPWAGLVDEDT